MDPNDDELLRYYCRSAMPGTWGLVADLSKIEEHQRSIILREVDNYRRLNELKSDYLYEVQLPAPNAEAASITFYNRTRTKAAAIVYRWDAKGAFDHTLIFRLFASTPPTYRIEDIDTGKFIEAASDLLASRGIPVLFARERLSAILFVSVK